MSFKTRASAARRSSPQDIQYPRRRVAPPHSHRRDGVRAVARFAPMSALPSPAHYCQIDPREDLMPDADDGPSPQPAVRALAGGSP